MELTDDLRSRFKAHNAGRSPHTRKFRPWRLLTHIVFFASSLSDKHKRQTLNCISSPLPGRAFANKCLRQLAAKYRLHEVLTSQNTSAGGPPQRPAELVNERLL